MPEIPAQPNSSLEEDVREIRKVLFIGNGQDSLITKVSKLCEDMRTIKRLTWIVLAAVIGYGVAEAIYIVSIHPVPGIKP